MRRYIVAVVLGLAVLTGCGQGGTVSVVPASSDATPAPTPVVSTPVPTASPAPSRAATVVVEDPSPSAAPVAKSRRVLEEPSPTAEPKRVADEPADEEEPDVILIPTPNPAPNPKPADPGYFSDRQSCEMAGHKWVVDRDKYPPTGTSTRDGDCVAKG